MRRPVLRILLNAATVLSLLLCVVILACWIRSYWRTDSLRVEVSGEVDQPGDHGPISLSFVVASSRGSIYLERWEDELRVNSDDPAPPPPSFHTMIGQSAGPWTVETSQWGHEKVGGAGFTMGSESYRGTGAASVLRYVVVPDWCLVLALALMAWPTIRLLPRPKASGLCRHCGYDCRATPDRCPECGTPRRRRSVTARKTRKAGRRGGVRCRGGWKSFHPRRAATPTSADAQETRAV